MAYDEKKLATLGDVKAAASRTKQAYEQKFTEVGGSLYESTKTDPQRFRHQCDRGVLCQRACTRSQER